jgi:hypothetical protein
MSHQRCPVHQCRLCCGTQARSRSRMAKP